MSTQLELYTFTISHFSEKARWALELEGIPYEEKRLLPGLHPLTTRRWAPLNSVPLLRHGKLIVQGSGRILRALPHHFGARRLVPEPSCAEACDEIETLADRSFGRGLQQIAYGELLQHRAEMIQLWSLQGPKWAKAFYFFTYPFVAAIVKRMYRPVPSEVERAKAAFRLALDRTDELLGRSPYLLGSSLTRADITVAALLAPFLRPPEHPVAFPELPPGMQAFCDEFADGATARHVRRLYREYRRTGVFPSHDRPIHP